MRAEIEKNPLLSLVLVLLALMQGGGLYLESRPQNVSVDNTAVLAKLDKIEGEIADIETFMATTELRVNGLEVGVENHWRSPHPDNTRRAEQNNQDILALDRRVTTLEYGMERHHPE